MTEKPETIKASEFFASVAAMASGVIKMTHRVRSLLYLCTDYRARFSLAIS